MICYYQMITIKLQFQRFKTLFEYTHMTYKNTSNAMVVSETDSLLDLKMIETPSLSGINGHILCVCVAAAEVLVPLK